MNGNHSNFAVSSQELQSRLTINILENGILELPDGRKFRIKVKPMSRSNQELGWSQDQNLQHAKPIGKPLNKGDNDYSKREIFDTALEPATKEKIQLASIVEYPFLESECHRLCFHIQRIEYWMDLIDAQLLRKKPQISRVVKEKLNEHLTELRSIKSECVNLEMDIRLLRINDGILSDLENKILSFEKRMGIFKENFIVNLPETVALKRILVQECQDLLIVEEGLKRIFEVQFIKEEMRGNFTSLFQYFQAQLQYRLLTPLERKILLQNYDRFKNPKIKKCIQKETYQLPLLF